MNTLENIFFRAWDNMYDVLKFLTQSFTWTEAIVLLHLQSTITIPIEIAVYVRPDMQPLTLMLHSHSHSEAFGQIVLWCNWQWRLNCFNVAIKIAFLHNINAIREFRITHVMTFSDQKLRIVKYRAQVRIYT